MFYFRLWRRLVAMSLMREAEYRASFALSAGGGLLQLVVAALTIALIYQYIGAVAGWTRAEALLVLGLYRTVEGLLLFQFGANLWEVPGMIRRGELDMVLVRPVSSRFLASARKVELAELSNVLIGLAFTAYAGQQAGIRWSALGLAQALIFGVSGLLLLYVVWFAIVTLAFWLIDTGPLSQVVETLRETARYPISFFPGAFRTFLTFVFPVAFATTFPAAALRGQADWRLLLAGVAMAAGGLLLTQRFWDYALRHYSSASS
jgi:ABC-2 type transport system permease protein